MNRRRYLSALAAGTLAGLAGCAAIGDSGDGGGPSRTTGIDGVASADGTPVESRTGGSAAPGAATDGPNASNPGDVAAIGDVELPLPESELRRGAPRDAIPAIVDPQFGRDWSDLESRSVQDRSGIEYTTVPSLDDGETIIGVERDGRARAYPLAVLDWHEIVNDSFGGPLLVTYCPLCGSGLVARRRVAGEETTFGVSGYLWRSNLVMYDRATDSLWNQISATAIRGPRTGETLELVPSTLTTWGGWREAHPDGEVLLPPPLSGTVAGEVTRDYERAPYLGYDESERIGIGGGEFEDDRLHPKTTVIGVTSDGVARAYPLDAVTEAGVINDTVGGLPVVVAVGPGGTLVAYERRVGKVAPNTRSTASRERRADGEIPEFAPDGEAHMTGGGSRWEIVSGRAVDGPYEGTVLQQANEVSPEFFFAWLEFHPDTEVYGA
jgi:hypothetical protein